MLTLSYYKKVNLGMTSVTINTLTLVITSCLGIFVICIVISQRFKRSVIGLTFT
jgi:hypothetical protein